MWWLFFFIESGLLLVALMRGWFVLPLIVFFVPFGVPIAAVLIENTSAYPALPTCLGTLGLPVYLISFVALAFMAFAPPSRAK